MPKLTIIAHVTANPGKTELVKTALEKLVQPTRTETGCITYDLHQDNTDPAHFMFFEVWESRALWQDHMKAPHLAAHAKATEGAVAGVVLHEMTQIA